VEEKSRHFTLMIMPETATAEVRRIRVSRRLISAVLIGFGLFVVSTLGALAWSLMQLDRARSARILFVENTSLRGEIDQLDRKLQEVTDTVDRLEHFETKLRTLTMISDPARNLAMGPVGGPGGPEVDLAPQLSAALKRDLMTDEEAAQFASARLDWVGAAAKEAIAKAEKLSVLLEGQQSLLAATPSRRPSKGYVTSVYGMRIDPFTGLAQLHTGIDFSASLGAPANATADGVVTFSGTHGAHGKMVEVDHGNGIETRYGHLSKMLVKVGATVKRGETIGEIGNTGRSTGPHLHYEILLNGIPQDPRRFMLE
jgi:murein DD-endopeptidase MepM/ murein hydrolase activator NlpD